MAACCGKSTTEDPVENQQGVMPTEMERSESCSCSLQYVHNIIRHVESQTPTRMSDDPEDIGIESRKVSDQVKCSLKLGSALWSFDKKTHGQ